MGQTIIMHSWQTNCCNLVMKFFLLGLLIVAGCTNQSERDQQTVSTVDSNMVAVGDSTPAILHIDTTAGNDTAFDVAMDSVGATITAKDTLRK